jgi:hypothetical protein
MAKVSDFESPNAAASPFSRGYRTRFNVCLNSGFMLDRRQMQILDPGQEPRLGKTFAASWLF